MSWKKRLLPTLNKPPLVESFLPLRRSEIIPKIIHQIYFSNKPLPAELSENMKNLKKMNPSWEHRIYDDTAMLDFIADNFPKRIFEGYCRINPIYGAARADFFRYLMLYKTGGIYLDIKSAASVPLDDVLREDDQFLLSQWRNDSEDRFHGWGLHDEVSNVIGGEFQQWYIAAAPGHPFLKAAIENVLRNIDVYNPGLHGAGQYGVLRVTGPIAYTLAISPHLNTHSYRMVDSYSDIGLRYSIYGDERHVTLFKDHYSILNDPIVMPTFSKNISAVAFNFMRVALRTCRAMFSASLEPSQGQK